MRLIRVFLPLGLLLLASGCGYVHFGRLPPERRTDEALFQAYTDGAVQQKILKQELALAYKERDVLKAALERADGGAATPVSELTRQLEATQHELIALRTRYDALHAERAPASHSGNMTVLALGEENARLKKELETARVQNAELAEKLTASVEATEEAQAVIAQLNTELLGQKQARERAEQSSRALRAQLEAVMARAGRVDHVGSLAADAAPSSRTETSRATSAPGSTNTLSALQTLRAPPSDAVPSVELHTSAPRHRTAAMTSIVHDAESKTTDAVSTPGARRTYVVLAGDTLEKIATKVYGSADTWGRIYSANADALSTGGLKPGMTLTIPNHE